jgi:hypothetical protein
LKFRLKYFGLIVKIFFIFLRNHSYYEKNTLRLGNHLRLIYGQSVKQNNRYGASVVFEDGLVLKSKDRYGPSLYFIDGQTIRSKNRYSSLDTIAKRAVIHNIAEVFCHSTVALKYHLLLKEIFKNEYALLPENLYEKSIKNSLPYFEANGLLHFRPLK